HLLTLASLIHTSFFFNHTPTTHIYTLSLHDALPISPTVAGVGTISAAINFRLSPMTMALRMYGLVLSRFSMGCGATNFPPAVLRSEEHTSELQSRGHLVCRLLLEKKKKEKREKRSST